MSEELRGANAGLSGDAEPVLEIHGLKYAHPDGTPVLDGVNLSVSSGESVVIMGGSGAGKSTLAELVFGLKGEGTRAGRVERTPCAALVLQEGALLDHLTVAGNLALVLRRRGKRADRDSLANLLAQVGLGPEFLKRRASELSGGQKRRVALARALCMEPQLLYCDEPSAGLDLDGVRDLGHLIRRLVAGSARAAVVVTHDPTLAALTGDRVLLLEEGRLRPIADWTEQGPPADERQVAERTEAIRKACSGHLSAARAKGAHRASGRFSQLFGRLLSPGDFGLTAWRSFKSLPRAALHFRDFFHVLWRTLSLSGLSGLPFFALVGGILGATFIMILVTASILPVEVTLEKVQAVPLTAMTPPLGGFLFAARSGSAVASWLGSMALGRQVDALRSLDISPEEYLQAPVWLGMIAAFLLSVSIFFGAMWLGAYLYCQFLLHVPNAASLLHPFVNEQIRIHSFLKLPLYAFMVATITVHEGLRPKRSSEDVARGITDVIILSTVAVVLSELLFASVVVRHAGS